MSKPSKNALMKPQICRCGKPAVMGLVEEGEMQVHLGFASVLTWDWLCAECAPSAEGYANWHRRRPHMGKRYIWKRWPSDLDIRYGDTFRRKCDKLDEESNETD